MRKTTAALLPTWLCAAVDICVLRSVSVDTQAQVVTNSLLPTAVVTES